MNAARFWLLAFALVIVIVALGCATATPQPTVTSGVKLETVNKSVLEPCVFVDEVPKVPGTLMKTDPAAKAQRRAAIIADAQELEDYVLRADSLLRGCAKPRTEAK